MTYPPFGLTEAQAEALIRFAAGFSADLVRLQGTEWASTPEVQVMLNLATATWKTIQAEDSATATPPQQEV
ncbi:hypothetical protein ACFY05_32945 [Microtetraspora fusca]|uniref:Uncharacterized protein n=1 Tax=Microtetraspora fusca TaxID=1997 RepID=A0ABW6VE58_MICFU